MVHQSGSQPVAFHAGGGMDGSTSEMKAGGRFRPAGQLPSEDIEKAARLRSIRIVEALSVEVLRKWRVAGIGHESSFTHICQPGEATIGNPGLPEPPRVVAGSTDPPGRTTPVRPFRSPRLGADPQRGA